jgi:putative transposase
MYFNVFGMESSQSNKLIENISFYFLLGVSRRNTEYRRTAKYISYISKFLWDIFFKTGRIPHKKKNKKKMNLKYILEHIPSYLSERYKYACLWQTHDILSSYIANIKYKFVN